MTSPSLRKRPSADYQTLNPTVKSDLNSQRSLPPNDYYMYDEYEWMLAGQEFAKESDGFSPVSRNMVEMSNKLHMERTLHSYLFTTFEPENNYYDDDEVDLSCITRRPPAYMIIGKPGIGSTTLAKRLAHKLNAVHISPETVIEYYRNREPFQGINLKQTLEVGRKLDDKLVVRLLEHRVNDFDVLHCGYILDGFPFFVTKSITFKEQLEVLKNFPIPPDFAFLLHMQDVDLYKRRIEQKFDPVTYQLYVRAHYNRTATDDPKFNILRKGGLKRYDSQRTDVGNVTDFSDTNTDITTGPGSVTQNEYGDLIREASFDGSKDFSPLNYGIIGRLLTRLEDNPVLVNMDLENYRSSLQLLQDFVDRMDRRKVLQVNAYWPPSVVYKTIWDFLESFGVAPVPVPVQILRPLDKLKRSFSGEDDGEGADEYGDQPCESYEDIPAEVDWEATCRAISIRGLVDPRFRWRISRWRNLCPVALKLGRSLAGRPELAVSFLDKVYFMSTQEAVDQFIFNPRSYLLPRMPASPVKFFVIGHPLAGKSLCAQELALRCNAIVVDMKKEVERRYEQVGFDHSIKVLMETTLETRMNVDKQNHDDWKRLERERRKEMHNWIARYIKDIAETEMNIGLEDERKLRREDVSQYRKEVEHHKLQDPIYMGPAACQTDQFLSNFLWKDFLMDIRRGKSSWPHQRRLELAWELFRQGKLYYKRNKKKISEHKANTRKSFEELLGEGEETESEENEETDMEDEEEGESDKEEEGEIDDEEEGEIESEEENKVKVVKRRRRRKRCKHLKVEVDITAEDVLDVTPVPSSTLDDDPELEESIRMRFPLIPLELVEAVPKPPEVTDNDPLVQDIVEKKMKETKIWIDSFPNELYIEVLRRACKNAQCQYRSLNPGGSITGGWIVENLMVDIEKWRSILRTPSVAPDQVIVLTDYNVEYKNIMNNLKRKYRLQHPTKKFKGEMEGEMEDLGEDEDLIVKLDENEFIKSLLVADDLTDSFKDTSSNMIDIERDKNLQKSPAGSENEFDVVLESVESKENRAETDVVELYSRGDTRALSAESEAETKRKNIKYKAMNYDMCVYLPKYSEDPLEQDDYVELGGVSQNELMPLEGSFGFNTASSVPVSTRGRSMQEMEGELDVSIQKPDKSDLELTPSGLLSDVDFYVSPEDPKNEDGNEKMTVSPKRKFLSEIRLFEEFWNMVIPVLHQQQIRYWEIGVVDENTAQEKVLTVWDELENRFTEFAKAISANVLKEEDSEALESLRRWGEPLNIPQTVKETRGEAEEEDDEDVSDEDDDDEEMPEKDELTPLEDKPDEYLKVVEETQGLRCFGDLKDYCPVIFFDLRLLRKGSPNFACKFRDRLYYCLDEECRNRFIENPKKFLPTGEPMKASPPRICVTGSPGCDQEEITMKLSGEYGLCFINFRQRLQEILKARFGKDIGPEKTGIIIPMEKTYEQISTAKSSDDLLLEEVDEIRGEDDEEENETITLTKEVAKETLRLQTFAEVVSIPLGSIKRTERLIERKWKKLTKIETYCKAFLENGIQLPEAALDEFIAPFWTEEPFKSIGFILVGFPNTDEDVNYLANHMFFPEFVYIMESSHLAIRNRLLTPAVDRWHKVTNPSGMRKVEENIKGMTPDAKIMNPLISETGTAGGTGNHMENSVLEYQTEGREKTKEFEKETWTYDDNISKQLTKTLYHYHRIYSKDIKFMKQMLNRHRIGWISYDTNLSLIESKNKLVEKITTSLKYRSSFLEGTFTLNIHEANALIHRGFFELSHFKRWCPVEIFNGNIAINMWNTSDVKKIPILHRRYIYFLAGEKSAKFFRENVWELINQAPSDPTVPLVLVVMGPPKSGKTTLAQKVATKLGLTYISGSDMIDTIMKHSSLEQFMESFKDEEHDLSKSPQPMVMAEEILSYARNGVAIPEYLIFRILDFALMQGKAQYHGVVFDDYPIDLEQLQDLLGRGVVPAVISYLNIEQEECYARVEKNRTPTHNFEDFAEDCDAFLDYTLQLYEQKITPTLDWYITEIQSLYDFDGSQNLEKVFLDVFGKCIYMSTKMKQYIRRTIRGIPSTLEGTCPLTSLIVTKVAATFGKYCPVALNDNNDLVRVDYIRELEQVVEYRGELYIFSTPEFAQKFIANPAKYLPPTCTRVLPPDLPSACAFNEQDFKSLEPIWGFLDVDPVLYVESDFHPKSLQHGNPQFCVFYCRKIFCFLNQRNLNMFMKKPFRYANTKIPKKSPKKLEPTKNDKNTPYGYLASTGVIPELRKALNILASKRPRVPSMDLDRCAALYMGYYFKSLNMQASYQIRQKYRGAMFHMVSIQSNTRQLLRDLQEFYGSKQKMIPDKLKEGLQDFLNLLETPDEDKVLIPQIPDLALGYDSVPDPDRIEIIHLVKYVLLQAEETENLQKREAFAEFSKKHDMKSSAAATENN